MDWGLGSEGGWEDLKEGKEEKLARMFKKKKKSTSIKKKKVPGLPQITIYFVVFKAKWITRIE